MVKLVAKEDLYGTADIDYRKRHNYLYINHLCAIYAGGKVVAAVASPHAFAHSGWAEVVRAGKA